MLGNTDGPGQPGPLAHQRHERRLHRDPKILIADGCVAFVIEKLPGDMGSMVNIIDLAAP